jgi:hypothetical protein
MKAKRIAWERLKQLTRPCWASKPNETDLRIELITGGTICLRGADNYDSLRGDGLDFLVLDEYASMAHVGTLATERFTVSPVSIKPLEVEQGIGAEHRRPIDYLIEGISIFLAWTTPSPSQHKILVER